MAKAEKFVASSKTMLMRANGGGRMPSDKGGDKAGKDTVSRPGSAKSQGAKRGR